MKKMQLAKKQIKGTLSRIHAIGPHGFTLCFLIVGPNWREVKGEISCRSCLKCLVRNNPK